MSESAHAATQPTSASREQARQQMIDALREAAGRLGPNVTLRQFAEESGMSTSRVYRRFGSWGRLRMAAGLPPRGDRRGQLAVYSRSELISAMQKARARHGARLSQATFCRETGISPGPIGRLFGGWGGLREAVGLAPQTPHPSRPKYSRTELVEQLRTLVAEHGDMTLRAFCRYLGGSRQLVYAHGTWNELRTLAGLPVSPKRYTKEELLQHLQRLINERGDVTLVTFCHELHICWETLVRHGYWGDLRRELNLPPQGCTGRPAWATRLIGDLFDPLTDLPPLPLPLE